MALIQNPKHNASIVLSWKILDSKSGLMLCNVNKDTKNQDIAYIDVLLASLFSEEKIKNLTPKEMIRNLLYALSQKLSPNEILDVLSTSPSGLRQNSGRMNSEGVPFLKDREESAQTDNYLSLIHTIKESKSPSVIKALSDSTQGIFSEERYQKFESLLMSGHKRAEERRKHGDKEQNTRLSAPEEIKEKEGKSSTEDDVVKIVTLGDLLNSDAIDMFKEEDGEEGLILAHSMLNSIKEESSLLEEGFSNEKKDLEHEEMNRFLKSVLHSIGVISEMFSIDKLKELHKNYQKHISEEFKNENK